MTRKDMLKKDHFEYTPGGGLKKMEEYEEDKKTRKDVSPPGWKGTTEAMKKHSEIDNPWALAWYESEKGDEPHK